jgi:uncharacterized protein (TIGR03435 family)
VNARSLAASIALSAAVGLCQTPPTCTGFEVASVKPAPPLDASKTVAFGRQIDGAQIHFTQTSLRDMIRIAWAVKDYQIEAPAWLASARFDVRAKVPGMCTQKQVPAMLQSLLANQFALKLHRASKDLPVYGVVVRSDGLKMRKSPQQPDDPPPNLPEEVKLAGGGGRGAIVDYGGGSYFALPHYRIEARKLTMNRLASIFATMTNRPVIDHTGLSQSYDFDLDLPENDYNVLTTQAAISMGAVLSEKDLQELAGASDPLPKVARSLGLDLKPGKGPVEVFIVDDVRKTAIDN